jgi:uncharacterized protein YutE (UPF0331/DUF86 family)/predicted nucleotidyltransferase
MEVRTVLSEAMGAIKRARSIEPSTILESAALRWEIYASLQNILDAISMMMVDLNLRKPSSYSDLGSVLYESNLIDGETENKIRAIAAARNMLAHAYRRISMVDLQKIKGEILTKAESVIREMLRIIEERGIDPESPSKNLDALIQPFRRHGVLLAYLFGSRARGNFRDESDYDIAVLFAGEETSIIDEINLTLDLAKSLKEPVEKVNVVSLNNADVTIKARILREGIPIYCCDDQFRRRWERTALMEVLDSSDLYAIYSSRMLKPKQK